MILERRGQQRCQLVGNHMVRNNAGLRSSSGRLGLGQRQQREGSVVRHLGHLTKQKIGHLANRQIPQMADASGGFFLYTGGEGRNRSFVHEVT